MLNDSRVQLHHIGILAKNLTEAADAYQRRFGYRAVSDVIHDPVQTAFVQFFQMPGEVVFTELITPDGPASKLTNALRKGGGLHHLCYSVTELDQVCEDLRGEGMTLISRPAPAVAFHQRRVVWLMGTDRLLVELVEKAPDGEL